MYEDDVHQEVKQELCNEISKEETSPSKREATTI